MEWIVVFGASGHAQVIIDIIEAMNLYRIAGIYDDNPFHASKMVAGYPVLGLINSNIITKKGIVGIGDNNQRANVVQRIQQQIPGFDFISAIHPSSIIGKNVSIGQGVAIMAGCVVNTNTVLGPHSVVNTMSSIDHDCKLEAFASVSPGAHLGGNVLIGERSFIGMGSHVIHSTTVGPNTIIGAGATVVHDIPNNVVAFGTPAKVQQIRLTEERYL